MARKRASIASESGLNSPAATASPKPPQPTPARARPPRATPPKSRPSAPPAAITVSILRLPHASDLPLPAYQTANAAGLDLMAAVGTHAPIHLARHARVLIPTGLALALPPGFEAQVRPRSGLALKHGVTVLNSPGTIDADYRGEIAVILINLGDADFVIRRGDRIAQLVIAPVTQAALTEVTVLDATPRGTSGFGSTGSSSKPR